MRLASDIRIVNVVSTAELVLFDERNMPADLAKARTAELVLHEEQNMSVDLAKARIADTQSSKLTAPINLRTISNNLMKNNRIDSVKYKPDKFIAAILKQSWPIKSTCLLFESGKFVCLGKSYYCFISLAHNFKKIL